MARPSMRKKTPAQQRHEATRIFQFLSTANGDYDMLVLMTSPVPLLIQVPGTNKVRFICGVAPYRGDPSAASLPPKLKGNY
jgi:hypothetical protein